MRRTVKAFILVSVALFGCRAILDIEEIEEAAPDAGTGTPDAAADSVPTDSATDTNRPPVGDGGVNQNCINACRQSAMGTPALPKVEQFAKNASCICGSAGCTAECPTVCSGTAGMPTIGCVTCIDKELLGPKPECGKALNDCIADNECKSFGQCLATCRN